MAVAGPALAVAGHIGTVACHSGRQTVDGRVCDSSGATEKKVFAERKRSCLRQGTRGRLRTYDHHSLRAVGSPDSA